MAEIKASSLQLRAAALWQEWNEKINVISRKDSDAVFEHHILHSLAVAEYLRRFYPGKNPFETAEILDLGTGGGFPGIPLAMEFENASFTLCDSVGKKIKVAQAVAEGLGLKNVRCVNSRAEELKGQWDYAVSRAVAPLNKLYGWAGDKIRRSLICLKGGDLQEEIALLRRRFGISEERIRVWKISDWLENEYFAEKFVIEVGKSYLCSPFVENIKR